MIIVAKADQYDNYSPHMVSTDTWSPGECSQACYPHYAHDLYHTSMTIYLIIYISIFVKTCFNNNYQAYTI